MLTVAPDWKMSHCVYITVLKRWNFLTHCSPKSRVNKFNLFSAAKLIASIRSYRILFISVHFSKANNLPLLKLEDLNTIFGSEENRTQTSRVLLKNHSDLSTPGRTSGGNTRSSWRRHSTRSTCQPAKVKSTALSKKQLRDPEGSTIPDVPDVPSNGTSSIILESLTRRVSLSKGTLLSLFPTIESLPMKFYRTNGCQEFLQRERQQNVYPRDGIVDAGCRSHRARHCRIFQQTLSDVGSLLSSLVSPTPSLPSRQPTENPWRINNQRSNVTDTRPPCSLPFEPAWAPWGPASSRSTPLTSTREFRAKYLFIRLWYAEQPGQEFHNAGVTRAYRLKDHPVDSFRTHRPPAKMLQRSSTGREKDVKEWWDW